MRWGCEATLPWIGRAPSSRFAFRCLRNDGRASVGLFTLAIAGRHRVRERSRRWGARRDRKSKFANSRIEGRQGRRRWRSSRCPAGIACWAKSCKPMDHGVARPNFFRPLPPVVDRRASGCGHGPRTVPKKIAQMTRWRSWCHSSSPFSSYGWRAAASPAAKKQRQNKNGWIFVSEGGQ